MQGALLWTPVTSQGPFPSPVVQTLLMAPLLGVDQRYAPSATRNSQNRGAAVTRRRASSISGGAQILDNRTHKHQGRWKQRPRQKRPHPEKIVSLTARASGNRLADYLEQRPTVASRGTVGGRRNKWTRTIWATQISHAPEHEKRHRRKFVRNCARHPR